MGYLETIQGIDKVATTKKEEMEIRYIPERFIIDASIMFKTHGDMLIMVMMKSIE